MKIFGYAEGDDMLLTLSEASFQATADELRRLGEFLQETADTIDRAGAAFGHEHFRDFCRRRGIDSVEGEADVIAAGPPNGGD